MNSKFPDGVWPTMITPFNEKNEIDYSALENLIEWYIKNGVDGLFAVCQSSEMFFLSLEERLKLAAFVLEKAAGRVPVIASGHISDSLEDQVRELTLIGQTGIAAVVMITNRFASQNESDDIWKENLVKVLKQLPEDMPLAFYECPYPYKRVISPSLLKWCAGSGRFFFLKDTSCDIDTIKAKLEAVKGTGLKVFNANTATLLESLKLGAAGFSGVMANFHPDLYVWLTKHWSKEQEKAARLSDFLSLASLIEKQHYPVNAKYYQMLEGVNMTYDCRAKDRNEFTATNRLEVEQLYRLSKEYTKLYNFAK